MRKKKILTVKNRIIMERKLEKYLEEVLKEEEHINSFEKAFHDAERVEVYGNRKTLTPALVSDWLRGLPIGIEYVTYNVCVMLLSFIGKEESEVRKPETVYYDYDCAGDLDDFYWKTLGRIIYRRHFE